MAKQPLINVQIKSEAEVSALFDDSLAASECQTRGQFLELLLEKYHNPKTQQIEVSKTSDVEALQAANLSIQNQQSEIEAQAAEIRTLNAQILQSGVIPPNHILFPIAEGEIATFDEWKAYYSKVYKRDFTLHETLYFLIREKLYKI